MSATANLGARFLAANGSRLGSFFAGSSVFLALLLTLVVISADQLASPILRTTSPLLATLAFLLLVWRRGQSPLFDATVIGEGSLSAWRLSGFLAMHVVLIFLSRSMAGVAGPFSGTATLRGTIVGLGKLAVLAPTLLLLPVYNWKRFFRAYVPEALAATLVLAINVPSRFVEFIWPWYGRMLGWVVYLLARGFALGLSYQPGPEPTILGPLQDTSLIPSCSGMESFELLSYVFAFVVLLDWNRLRKGRAFQVYLGCLSTILVCNALRIAIVVVLFNRGYSAIASSFHLTASSFFFFTIFLVYMSLTHRWMTDSRHLDAAPAKG